MDIHADDSGDRWQFGRVAPASNGAIYHSFGPEAVKKWEAIQGEIVRVRPIAAHPWVVEAFRQVGCDSNIFMTVHPDDLTRLGIMTYPTQVTCEHVIYTD